MPAIWQDSLRSGATGPAATPLRSSGRLAGRLGLPRAPSEVWVGSLPRPAESCFPASKRAERVGGHGPSSWTAGLRVAAEPASDGDTFGTEGCEAGGIER